nr:glycosyltransferase [Thermoleophilaceae bacterium]
MHEGFCLPVLEAMAAGTPVVASNLTALPEICGDAAVLAAPADFAEAVLEALDRAEELRAKGRERAKLFTWRRSAEAMDAAMDALLTTDD